MAARLNFQPRPTLGQAVLKGRDFFLLSYRPSFGPKVRPRAGLGLEVIKNYKRLETHFFADLGGWVMDQGCEESVFSPDIDLFSPNNAKF